MGGSKVNGLLGWGLSLGVGTFDEVGWEGISEKTKFMLSSGGWDRSEDSHGERQGKQKWKSWVE